MTKNLTDYSISVESHSLPHDITVIDTRLYRPNMAAFYLIESGEQAAFIETGTRSSAQLAMELLKRKKIDREKISYVIPTHVHLDHAGGAGSLMELFPNARLVIHKRGARHMIDPAKLWAGVVEVYGEEEAKATYGELIPVPEQRILIAEDGERIDLNGRIFEFRDTPGHARHHFCIWDEMSRGWFTGDTFGVAYPEFTVAGKPFVMPTTTPVQFDPDALLSSIDLLLSYEPECMYLTHFGMVPRPEASVDLLRSQIHDYCRIAENNRHKSDRVNTIRADITELTLDKLAKHGVKLPETKIFDILDIEMPLNAQGIDIWLGE